ncbi:cryptochrome/photolyase family protein [Legionella gresilensis]|uniref:cryptochrome/photolyase family protein n=1 Tax=Legionella gresilensis TaxID=91823 RepID=UPI00104103A0|nr:deoxyribodipyrimidine photo-lyase [Legionella gresilensis]
MSTAIIWFRQDLRCQDNPALTAACHEHDIVIPLYIAENNLKHLGSAQKWWLHHSLLALKKNLQSHGLDLFLVSGAVLSKLQELITTYQVDTVYWNRRYQPDEIEQDKKIEVALNKNKVSVKSFKGNVFLEPWEIQNQKGNYFKVFPPFWRHCFPKINQFDSLSIIKKWPHCPKVHTEDLNNWELIPTKPNWADKFNTVWQPGENSALQKLSFFIENNLSNYRINRDYPAKNANSSLSPHLHFGEISLRQIWQAVNSVIENKSYHASSIEQFLTELGWRDFCYHQLYHLPQISIQNLKPQFNHLSWRVSNKDFTQWCQGRTGFPMVDAGMRQLWQTGFMHNRLRMITASFLVKNLLIDWRLGAKWFLDTLVDADLAINSFNWQWIAGSGFEACPPFRIFNPITQGEKFDPNGDYVKNWIPELACIPKKKIHKPWQEHDSLFELGKDYPLPMVDLQISRQHALTQYRDLKNVI